MAMMFLFLVDMSTGNKRKWAPSDAQWCLNNINELSLKSFAVNFSLYDRMYAHTRYKNIITKNVPAEQKGSLIQEMAIWMKLKDVVDKFASSRI
jgi:hypothetical protein